MVTRSSRLIFGVGINDATYHVTWNEITESGRTLRKSCRYYRCWVSMLQRSCSKKFKDKFPTYKDVTVCEEWLLFSNFKSWMEKQDWEGKELDKDIIFPGNKEYNPKTCCFVDQVVNKFVLERDAVRGKYPIGVYLDSGQSGVFKYYKSVCGNPFTNKRETLGRFKTPEEAHVVWLERKLHLAKELASMIEDTRVANALIWRYENYGRWK